MSAKPPSTPRNITLLQYFLIAVVIVFVILLMLPAINAPRSRGRHPCLRHLKALGLAVINYEVDKGHFPLACVTDDHGNPLHSWRVLVLPYLDDPVAQGIYDEYRFDEPWNSPHNQRLAKRMPDIYRCPDEISDDPLHTSYVAIVGADTMWPPRKGRRLDEITDGTSRTLLLIEQPNSGIHWMEPRDVTLEEAALGQPNGRRNHGGDVVVCIFADGHTQAICSIDKEVLQRLLTVAGGEENSSEDRYW